MIRKLLLLSVLLAACEQSERSAVSIEFFSVPVPTAVAADLTIAGGRPTLSWIDGDERNASLEFSQFNHGSWGPRRTIARGSDWFINWADFPAVFAANDSRWFAHWLRKSGASSYAYDVMTATSNDGGTSWRRIGTPHRDGSITEHGFVSFYKTLAGGAGMAWLDGRHTAGEHGAHVGAMTLRTTTWNGSDAWNDTLELDPRVCDCCQTDAALTAQGPVVVFRDRSPDEVRDIALVRHQDGRWTQPTVVHADGWQIEACPVNGPAIAARNQALAVAWFTMADGDPAVKVSQSTDGGRSFAAPLRLDQGQPLGRVDVGLLQDRRAVVSWLETDRFDETRVHLALIESGKIVRRTQLGLLGSDRSSGFPRLAVTIDDDVWLAWRELADDNSRLRTAQVRFE